MNKVKLEGWSDETRFTLQSEVESPVSFTLYVNKPEAWVPVVTVEAIQTKESDTYKLTVSWHDPNTGELRKMSAFING